jgi:hypothetical protein
VGIATDANPSDPSFPGAYAWSKIVGSAGVPGPPGPDGTPRYIWVAYANDINGQSNFTTGAWSGQTYIGVAPNQTTPIEGGDPSAYTWSLIKGDQGPQGVGGPPGPQGASATGAQTTGSGSGQYANPPYGRTFLNVTLPAGAHLAITASTNYSINGSGPATRSATMNISLFANNGVTDYYLGAVTCEPATYRSPSGGEPSDAGSGAIQATLGTTFGSAQNFTVRAEINQVGGSYVNAPISWTMYLIGSPVA